MDQLEAQATDLRFFLEKGPPAPAVVSPMATASAYSPAGTGPLSRSAPGANSAHHHQRQRQASLQSSSPGGPLESPGAATAANSAANKRRADDDDADAGPAKQQRTKRNRYISIACNECKRRKIKCNGETPCQRCGHLNLPCLYAPNCCSNFKDSDEFKNLASQVGRLQDQVETLYSAMNALREETTSLRLAPIQPRSPLPPSMAATRSPSTVSLPPLAKPPYHYRVAPSFNGPTSIAFTVDVAKTTLHKMGYSGPGDGDGDSSFQPEHSPRPSPVIRPTTAAQSLDTSGDPIWEFGEAEMLRLCQLYEDEVGAMYPVISADGVLEHAKFVFSWMSEVRRTGQSNSQLDLNDHKTLLLKIVLCNALTVEEHGHSDKAARLYESIQPIIDRMLMSDPADPSTLPILALVSGYRYLSNDEILAWRVVGHIARLCLELGLHRREGVLKISDPLIRRNALVTFWSSYVLDRRWSFSTGLPFVCHDDKIDPNLPYPEDYPFLIAMIGYSKLSAKIWSLVDCFEPAVIRDLKPHNFEQLEQDIWDWYESVPEQIRTDANDGDRIPMPASPTDKLQRVRIWTRLRLNQVRIWLYTPVLHSATSIHQNKFLAERAVDLAKQTIRLLAHINRTTSLYRRCQVFYHQFLTSSIAVLFLASTHAPIAFSVKCRDEFYMALDLVRDMSERSWVSRRLWKTIRSLKDYARRVGLEEEGDAQGQQKGNGVSSNARYSGAAAGDGMGVAAGGSGDNRHGRNPLGGSGSRASPVMIDHQSPGLNNRRQAQAQGQEDQSNGVRLQTEMSRMFEGYLSMNGVGGAGRESPTATDLVGYDRGGIGMTGTPEAGMMDHGAGVGVALPAGDEGVYQSLREMF